MLNFQENCERSGIKIPEGPELRHSRDVISKLIVGKNVFSASPTTVGRYAKKLPDGFSDFVNELPVKVLSVDTKGKFMWWTMEGISGKIFYMHCTYGMSGGWFKSATTHTAFVVEFGSETSESMLFFNDIRHFGTIKFVHNSGEHKKKLQSIGPCILSNVVTPEIFAENILKKPSRTIAEALMDQSGVSGIGNYIKAEVLIRSGVSPWRQVTEVSSEEYVKLCNESRAVATESYKSQGATLMTYKTADGSTGSAQFSFRVYNKKACHLGHSTLRQETPDGRTSWWCPTCQK